MIHRLNVLKCCCDWRRECCNGCRSFNKRLGAENVNIVYRRSLEELPARIEEYHHSLKKELTIIG